MKFKFHIGIIFSVLFATLSVAVVAKEAVPMAMDPELEKIVNEISAELRCLVCQNQTIADSHAELAVDLKNQVREMVSSGKTEDDIVDYMVQRYGDFVRYRPPMKPTTILLWVGPFVLMVTGVLILFLNLKKRRELVTDTPLSEEESSEFDAIMQNQSQATRSNTAVKDKKS